MSYTPTEWKSGDVITSENLNKLEQGVAAAGGGGGGVLAVGATMTETTITLDKTWKEIKDAPLSFIVFETNEEGFYYKSIMYISGVSCETGIYQVLASSAIITETPPVSFEPLIFSTTSENGYPSTDAPQ